VAKHAGFLDQFPTPESITVRGVAEPMQVIGVTRGRDLPASILVASSEDDRNGVRGSLGMDAHG
jgi:hypothetical protein